MLVTRFPVYPVPLKMNAIVPNGLQNGSVQWMTVSREFNPEKHKKGKLRFSEASREPFQLLKPLVPMSHLTVVRKLYLPSPVPV